MKRALLLLAVLTAASGCGRKVVVHPDKVATKADPAWRITSEPGAAPQGVTATPPPTAPLPPTTPQGTPTAPPGTPTTPPRP